jgi:outer membrane protein insertion porin family
MKGYGLVAAWLVLPLALAASSSNPGPAATPAIARVEVMVDGQKASPEIRSLVTVRAGDPFSLYTVDRSIKQLYSSGLFSDIRVDRRDVPDLTLAFSLSRKFFVRKMILRSAGSLPLGKVQQRLTVLRPGTAFSSERLEKAGQEVVALLEREGYFECRAVPVLFKDSEAAAMDITFNVVPGLRYVISSLSFSGEVPLPASALIKRMASREGQPYVPSLLEKDIAGLEAYLHGFGYSRAKVETAPPRLDDSLKTAALSLNVEAGEKIEISITGAQIPVELVRPIWEEKVFEEWGLEEGEARILSTLRKKGYLFALVSSTIQREGNRLLVKYEADPGLRCTIRGLRFDGLTHLTSEQLKNALDLEGSLLLPNILDGERVFSLPGEIEDLYQTRGFQRARVELNLERTGRAVTVVYRLEEGPQQILDRVTFSGASLFPAERLLSEVSSRSGGPFYQPNIQKDVEKLETFYLNQGLRGTKISALITPRPDDRFDLEFRVQEGRMVRLKTITIIGQKVTRRSTILREVRLKEGQPVSLEAINETRRNLEHLGIFAEVKIEEILVPPDEDNLVIRLQEGEQNYMSLGLGVENKNMPFQLAVWENVISPRGTAEYIRTNIFGDASQFSLVGQFSLREKRGVVSLEQPYFFGLPLQNYLNGWLEREDRMSYGFDRRGLSFTGIKPLFKDSILLATLTWASTTLYYLDIAENEIDRQFFPFSKTSIAASILWDKRDDALNTTRGMFFSASLEWAYPLFGVESDFLKLFVKYQHTLSLFSAMTFSGTARLGLGQGRMPIHERFFAGGSNSFRGTDFDELGPRDSISGQPVGGKVLLLFNLEVSFPLIGALEDLSLAFFYDKGNVFAKRKDFDLGQLKDAVGFGLRYRTPLGPLRLDIGLNPEAPPGQKKIFPTITIGNVF